MTAAFLVGAAALALLAWWLLRPAWRPVEASAVSAAPLAAPAHLQVLREQLAALDRALAAGEISAGQHAQERADMQRRVLAETPPEPPPRGVVSTGRRTQWFVTAGLPLLAAALYLAIGNPTAINTTSTLDNRATDTQADADASPEALLAMLTGMEQRLQQAAGDTSPNALQGWTLLARSYASLRRFADAERAYARATALAPNDAQLLADRADVLSVLDSPGSAVDTASLRNQLVQQALQSDPRNLKALTLAGNAAFARKDFGSARTHWQQARALAPAGSAFATALDGNLEELARATSTMPASWAQDDAHQSDRAAGGGAGRVTGRVTLAPALAARAAPGDTVFVFARAADGPRMPLAILRRSVADLPFEFVLDDSLAMSPQHTLSGASQVVVGVRVSRSGNATAQRGDLRSGSAATTLPAANLQLVIDSVEP